MTVKRLFDLFFKNVKKLGKSQFFRAKFYVTNYAAKYDVDDRLMLFEAFSGDDFSGNPFYVLENI